MKRWKYSTANGHRRQSASDTDFHYPFNTRDTNRWPSSRWYAIVIRNNYQSYSSPVIVWSLSLLDGGVCDGVWWCDASPKPAAVNPPYNALKSSGVLLHFRFWCSPVFLPTPPLSKWLPLATADRKSCDNPNNRFSCDAMPISRLSCSDMNLASWCPPCCRLPCANAWSSRRPCCSPNRPPTRFGRRSSMSLPVCVPHVPPPPADAAVKFNCLLNIAGKILNCCEISVGLDDAWFTHRLWVMLLRLPPVADVDVVLLPPLPPAAQ